MIVCLAHHMEAQHVPVLAAIFFAGAWMGWRLVSRFIGKKG